MVDQPSPGLQPPLKKGAAPLRLDQSGGLVRLKGERRQPAGDGGAQPRGAIQNQTPQVGIAQVQTLPERFPR